MALVVKNPRANAGDLRDTGSIPGSGRSPGGGQGNSLQYFCLENRMDRGAWRATVLGVAKSQTRLSVWAAGRTYPYENSAVRQQSAKVQKRSPWGLGCPGRALPHSARGAAAGSGTSLVVPWLRLCAPSGGGPGLIPGQGTRDHMLQPRVHRLRLETPRVIAKTKDPSCCSWDLVQPINR